MSLNLENLRFGEPQQPPNLRLEHCGFVKIILSKVTQDKQASTFIDFGDNEDTLFKIRGTKFDLWPVKMNSKFNPLPENKAKKSFKR